MKPLEIIEYDTYGRMKYNPAFHSKTGNRWSQEDMEYLIDWYDIIGAEEMSFALERAVGSIQEKVRILRKKGVMEKSKKKTWHKRIKKDPLQRVQK